MEYEKKEGRLFIGMDFPEDKKQQLLQLLEKAKQLGVTKVFTDQELDIDLYINSVDTEIVVETDSEFQMKSLVDLYRTTGTGLHKDTAVIDGNYYAMIDLEIQDRVEKVDGIYYPKGVYIPSEEDEENFKTYLNSVVNETGISVGFTTEYIDWFEQNKDILFSSFNDPVEEEVPYNNEEEEEEDTEYHEFEEEEEEDDDNEDYEENDKSQEEFFGS